MLSRDKDLEDSCILRKYIFILPVSASGCAHYQAPVNTSVEMEDVYATVTCNFTGDVWTYECRGTTWVLQEGNTVENCTRGKGFFQSF